MVVIVVSIVVGILFTSIIIGMAAVIWILTGDVQRISARVQRMDTLLDLITVALEEAVQGDEEQVLQAMEQLQEATLQKAQRKTSFDS